MIDTIQPLTVKRLIRFDGGGTVRAYCDLALGELLIIRGLRIVKGSRGVFVSMPRQQGKDGRWFDMISPISKDIRAEIERVLLEAYEQQEKQAPNEVPF